MSIAGAGILCERQVRGLYSSESMMELKLPDDVCCLLELEKKVHMKVCIHGEGPY